MSEIHDPKLYRELCEPFESLDEFAAMVNSFAEEVRALRKKYAIPDAVLIVSANVIDGGREDLQTFMASMGDSRNVLTMVRDVYADELRKSLAVKVMA